MAALIKKKKKSNDIILKFFKAPNLRFFVSFIVQIAGNVT